MDEGQHLRPHKRLLVDVTASRAGLDKALAFANDLFNALESAGHRVLISSTSENFTRARIEANEQLSKARQERQDSYYYDRRWSPQRPTVVYVGSVAFGLAVIEMSESVLLRYVNGKYIRESDYKPPKASARYLDHSWTTTQDIPCGRLRLVVYAPYRGVSWSTSFDESKDRALTTDIPKIVKSIKHSTEALVEMVKEEERQAEIRQREWEAQRERWRQYLRFAESLCDKIADALAASESLTARLRNEARNWRFKQVKAGPVTVERDAQRRFLTSGSALLRHTLAEAWHRFILPARLAGAVFFLDDLQNLSLAFGCTALTIRDQFQALAVEGLNFSVCFSAKADYFSGIHSFAEPAARFYSKIVLAPFTPMETLEYAEAVFGAKAIINSLAEWLYEKTLGHPYFLAFISRELMARNGSPSEVWHEIAAQLEREKFLSDLAQLSEKDVALLRALARADEHEVSPNPFVKQFQYEYFRRLTDRGLLIRSGRGRYKLYHPLFRQFLQQQE